MADTPARYIRIPNALWKKSMRKADEVGTDVSKEIRDHLEQWTADDDEDSSIAEILARIMADLGTLQRRLHVKVKRH